LIDLHTHLDLYPDPMKVAEEVNRRNEFTLVMTTSPRAWQATSKHFSQFDNIAVALGLHPEIATEKAGELALLISNIPSVRFIGEIGLDGSQKHTSSITLQKQIFENILKVCAEVGDRILSIHSRAAVSEVISLLSAYPTVGKPVLHWFSGSQKELRQAIDLGCWFSVGPSMVNYNSGKTLVANMPRDKIVPESDGPFACINKKPIMPWEATNITSELSEIWNTPIFEVERILINNYKSILS